MDWYRTGTYRMDSDPPGYSIIKIPDELDGEVWYHLLHKGTALRMWYDYQTLMEQAERHSGAIPP
jgi:hypothetical protein